VLFQLTKQSQSCNITATTSGLYVSKNITTVRNLPNDDRSKELQQLLIQADEDESLEESLTKINDLFASQTKYGCNMFQTMLESLQVRENTMVPISDEQGLNRQQELTARKNCPV
jgi:hypothetical protein